MSFLSSIVGAAIRTATLPVTAVIDLATLGELGLTEDQIEEILEDINESLGL